MTTRRAVAYLSALGVAGGMVFHLSGRAADVRPASTPASVTVSGSKIVAYYFHVNVRCTTCRTIEDWSRKTIQKTFAGELGSGKIEWKLVNVQQAENRHFIKDYQLFTRSLVLVRFGGGQQREYKVLNDTWQLVDDQPAFEKYVEREVRGFLAKL